MFHSEPAVSPRICVRHLLPLMHGGLGIDWFVTVNWPGN
jgi:hypothetical protein